MLRSGWSAGRTGGDAQGWWVRPPLPAQSSTQPLQVWSACILASQHVGHGGEASQTAGSWVPPQTCQFLIAAGGAENKCSLQACVRLLYPNS